eukprot:m.539977 g.539977  ORF g.539977 m.539977 type:complete len:616 (-) comp57638_c0_seq8:191-2038(-)
MAQPPSAPSKICWSVFGHNRVYMHDVNAKLTSLLELPCPGQIAAAHGMLAIACGNSAAVVHDTSDFATVATVKHTDLVSAVKFCHSQPWLASGDAGGKIILTDCISGVRIATYSRHARRIDVIYISANDAVVCAGSQDKRASVWRPDASGYLNHSASRVASSRSTMSRTKRSSSQGSGPVKLATLGELPPPLQAGPPRSADSPLPPIAAPRPPGPAKEGSSASISVPQLVVVAPKIDMTVSSPKGTRRTVDADTLSLRSKVSFAPSMAMSMVGGGKTKSPVTYLDGHTNWVTAVLVLSDERTCITGSLDETIRVWDWVSKVCSRVLPAPGGVWCLSLSRTEALFASATGGGRDSVTIYDAKSFGMQGLIQCGGGVDSVVLDEDSATVFAGVQNSGVCVFDLATGQPKTALKDNVRDGVSECGHTIHGLAIIKDPRAPVMQTVQINFNYKSTSTLATAGASASALSSKTSSASAQIVSSAPSQSAPQSHPTFSPAAEPSRAAPSATGQQSWPTTASASQPSGSQPPFAQGPAPWQQSQQPWSQGPGGQWQQQPAQNQQATGQWQQGPGQWQPPQQGPGQWQQGPGQWQSPYQGGEPNFNAKGPRQRATQSRSCSIM